MPIIVDVEGSYERFVVFIKSLEKYQRLVSVNSIEIKKSSEDGSKDKITATIKITVFLKK